jgi:hypothetical protein
MGDQPRSAAIIGEIQNLVRNNGPEWTVKRLKALKQSVINYLATQLAVPYAQRRFTPPEWYASGRGGFPKGHLGGLIRETLTGQYSDRKVSVLLSVLNTYTALVSDQTTPAQEKKFLEAIGGKPPEGLELKAGTAALECLEQIPQPTLDKLRAVFQRDYSEKFSFAGLNSAKPSLSPFSKRMRKWHPWMISMIESTMVTGPWTPILKDMGVPIIEGATPADHMGRIGVIQERGFKARVVAMPVAGAQVAFQPLHKALSSVLRLIPQDCTRDQGIGIRAAQKWLAEGKTVHAVDLSSATDNFPLRFQEEVLYSLGYTRIQQFRQTCRSNWSSDYGFLQYTKGQPMGLYGSFNLFALSHHILLMGIENQLGVDDSYRILGDDIIICDDKVHDKYLEYLERMSVPISADKCLDSNLFTEFAGKLISHSGLVVAAKAPKEQLKLLPVDNFINYCLATGNTYMIKDVPRQYREFALALAALPISFGGAGVNPAGISLLERISQFETVTRESIPKVLDLSSNLMEISLLGNPWVKMVTTYLNDQLDKVYSEMDTFLGAENPALAALAGSSEIKRSLVAQVLQSKDMDDTLAFVGGLPEMVRSRRSVIFEWKEALETSGARLSKAFDKHVILEANEKEVLDLPKGNIRQMSRF